ncbi:uncharacterized protein B0J16DRAFT_418661 [Fusarium flagelliforme]|uniref:uncharacterized protein n=1 Tax=Fusarium flagelliforme TaxID=2675880 RepID=UPI001E8E4181|nr:uncharacterized protein B0J16DRAFT_418661 [Fusarium flagelliforme]KAH7173355.1 hypothetical protein B0J16DRAFT_418661 [Fusarium flagelliforme]
MEAPADPPTSAKIVLPPQGNKIEISGNGRAHVGDVISFELPENMVREMSNLKAVISKAEAACRNLHGVLSTDKHVGEQLLDIAYMPQEIYQTLGTIKASLGNPDTRDSVIWATGSENTKSLLETCHTTIAEILGRIDSLNVQSPDPKAAESTVMSKIGVEEYRQVLTFQKISLNIVISMAYLYQTQITQEVFNTLKEQMTTLLQNLENERAERLPKAPPHHAIDRSTISADLEWSTKRYLAEAASIFTEAVQRNDPSIQVSSYLGQESMTTTLWTCASLSETLVGTDFVQIFITGLPIKNFDKLVVGIDLNDTVAEVRDSILRRLGLDRADFGLMHGNMVLTDTNATMKDYDVESNSSLRCVSFRPNRFAPGPWVRTFNLTILASDRSRVTLQLISDVAYPASLIKETFLKEYRRIGGVANDSTHVALLSKTEGLILDEEMIAGYAEDTGGSEYKVFNVTTLIAWIFRSKEQSDRFAQRFGRTVVRSGSDDGTIVSRLATLVEDGENEALGNDLHLCISPGFSPGFPRERPKRFRTSKRTRLFDKIRGLYR